MTRVSGFSGAIVAVMLAGCTTVVVEEPRPLPPPLPGPPAAGTCFAEDAGRSVGQIANARAIERATYTSGARTARIIRPGEAYTQEFNPDRLNIHVNRRNRIIRLTCG